MRVQFLLKQEIDVTFDATPYWQRRYKLLN